MSRHFAKRVNPIELLAASSGSFRPYAILRLSSLPVASENGKLQVPVWSQAHEYGERHWRPFCTCDHLHRGSKHPGSQCPSLILPNANPRQLAWIISLFGSVFAHVQTRATFPLFTWWTVVFYFFAIIGIFIVLASDATQTYHVAIVGYLGAGLVSSILSVNGLIYSNNGAREAAAAGFILLSMVTVSFDHR